MKNLKSMFIVLVLILAGCLTDTTRVNRATNNSTTTTGSNNASNNNSNNGSTALTTSGSTQVPTIVCKGDGDCNGSTCLMDLTDATRNRCGECLTSAQCPMLNASKCDADNLCVSCGGDSDCAHLTDTPGCDAGICRECTKDDHCDGTACDLSTNTCSDQVLGEGDQCEPCLSDAVCKPGSHCIVLSYKGQRNGQFCLIEKKSAPNERCPSREFSQSISRVSVSGHPASVHCGINESITTCSAIRSTGNRECYTQDNIYLCIADEEGGRCHKSTINPWTCSFACDSEHQCWSGYKCLDGVCGL